MIKRMKLSAYLTRTEDGRYQARSFLHDKTEIRYIVTEHDVTLNEISDKEVEGFVFVKQIGAQDTRVYVELPEGTDLHGKHVTVNKYSLVDPAYKIQDYLQK